MDSEYDPADPDAAMREMMGFSSFNKVARGTGKDKDTTTSHQPSGANSEPLQSRFREQGPATYSSQDVRSSIDSTNSSTPLKASAPKYVPNIPTFLTPASILPANLPPKPPTTFQPTTPSYEPSSTTSASGLPPLVHYPATTTSPSITQPPAPSFINPERSQPSPFTSSDIRYTGNPNMPYTPTYLSDGTLNPANTNPRPPVRINERGDTVYFKPSFVDPDPWRYAREAKEAKARNKGRNDGGDRSGHGGGGYYGRNHGSGGNRTARGPP